jgi:small GTP-binding protein
MGNVIGSAGALLGSIFCPLKKESTVALLGLDNSGKTTLIHTIEYKHSINLKTKPTIGISVQKVEYKNISLIIWDLGGQTATRKLWHRYIEDQGGLDCMLYMIDVCDEERFQQTVEVFYDIVATIIKQENINHKPMPSIFVCFNKIDLYREVKQNLIQALSQQQLQQHQQQQQQQQPTKSALGGSITIPNSKEGVVGKTLQEGTDKVIELKRSKTEPLTLPTTTLEDLIVKNKTNDLINLFKSNERFPLIRNKFVKFVPISAQTGEGCDYLLDAVYHKSLKL